MDILVVDDKPADLRLLNSILTDAGYRIRIAQTGEIALASVQLQQPELILLDVNLPDMDGYTVCDQLKIADLTQAIPIIFISASHDAQDKVKAFEAGGLDYITKPYQAAEVVARVKFHMAHNRLQRQIEAQNQLLQQQEERWQLLIQGTGDGIYDWNIPTNDLMMSPQYTAMLGYEPGEIPERHDAWEALLHPDDREAILSLLLQYLTRQIPKWETEMRLRCRDGSYRYILSRGQATWDAQGNPLRMVGVHQDITLQKQAETALKQLNQQLEQLATLDGLTQIANRRRFKAALQEEWQRLRREQQPLALIMLDIDYFKAFNDYYGHLEGDACLFKVAQTLQGCVNRPGDLVARYGGEEFILILPHTTEAGTVAIVQRIQQEIQALAIPHAASLVSQCLTVSMGVAISTVSSTLTPQRLVARADMALYRAKQHRNTWHIEVVDLATEVS